MKCAECRERMNSYLDDELEEQLRTSIESHLVDCSDCSLELANWRTSLSRLRETFPDQTPPVKLWERIQAKTETE
jgi:anti-sigma factor RsiW